MIAIVIRKELIPWTIPRGGTSMDTGSILTRPRFRLTMLLYCVAKLRVARDVVAKQVTCGDVRNVEVGGDQRALGALPRAWRSKQGNCDAQGLVKMLDAIRHQADQIIKISLLPRAHDVENVGTHQ